MTNRTALDGLHVLVTRPEQRAKTFVSMLQAAGAEAMTFPAITITEPLNTQSRDAVLTSIADYQMAIFISPTAVEKTFEHIDVLPDTLKLVALGKSTARTLKALDYTLSFEAKTQDSESLLAQPQMQAEQIAKQAIVIFRGEGGRTLLADTLRERGAQVMYADLYRRALPATEHLQTTQLSSLHAVCVTSNQSLQNLMLLCDDVGLLKTLPLFVPGHRCADLAQTLGFTAVHMASSATDDAMLAALVEWAKQR